MQGLANRRGSKCCLLYISLEPCLATVLHSRTVLASCYVRRSIPCLLATSQDKTSGRWGSESSIVTPGCRSSRRRDQTVVRSAAGLRALSQAPTRASASFVGSKTYSTPNRIRKGCSTFIITSSLIAPAHPESAFSPASASARTRKDVCVAISSCGEIVHPDQPEPNRRAAMK